MNMIRHKAISGQFKMVFLSLLLKQFKIYSPVIIDEKYLLPIVAALRNVVRKSCGYRSC